MDNNRIKRNYHGARNRFIKPGDIDRTMEMNEEDCARPRLRRRDQFESKRFRSRSPVANWRGRRSPVGRHKSQRDRGTHHNREWEKRRPAKDTFRVLDSRSYPEYKPPPEKQSEPATSFDLDEPEAESPLTLVSVLRMLCSLECHLGSLRAKALDMLSEALALEKNRTEPNAADELLDIEENCVFLETVGEKLKGILDAEVLQEAQKVRIVKKLIGHITGIMANRDVKKTKQVQLQFDTQLVASKLSQALDQNGVKNLDAASITRLMHFFMLLVKTKQQEGFNFDELPQRLELPNETELFREAEEEANQQVNSLSDCDLQVLLQNFQFLSQEEQQTLISQLRKLESSDALRVQRLRNCFQISGVPVKAGESCSGYLQRVAGGCKDVDDDDDYSFNELIGKVYDKSSEVMAQDTDNVIANLMGQLNSNNNRQPKPNYFGVPPPPPPPQQQQELPFGPPMVPAVGFENQTNPWNNAAQQPFYIAPQQQKLPSAWNNPYVG